MTQTQTAARVYIATMEDLPTGAGQSYNVNGEEIAVFKLTNGDVRAIENKSPHPKGGVLAEGLVSGHYVFCPVYDWKISLIDGKVQAPDEGSVKTYQIKIEGDSVYLVL